MYARKVLIKGYNDWFYGVEKTKNNGETWILVAATTENECNKILKDLESQGYLKWEGVPW